MARVVGIDHLVLSVGNFARSKDFYRKVLGFLGFKLKHEYPDMAGWSNGKTISGSQPPTPRARSTSTARATSAFTIMRSSFRAARMWTRSARSWSSTA